MLREVNRLKLRLGAGTSLRAPSRAEGTNKRGFTLIEVIVALTISALVVLVAHQLFAAVAARGRALTAARAALDRAANARRWLAATLLSLDVGTEGASGFEGRPNRTAFSAWLLTPDGWFERRQVTLGADRGRLVATLSSGTPIALRDSVNDVEFDYLLEPGAESRWVREWVSAVSAPLAIRIRIATPGNSVDTLVFLVKERG